jgi:hypothetical protein
MNDEHTKFVKVMGMRTKLIQSIVELWIKGNLRPIIQQFPMYKQFIFSIDIYVASDVLSQILKPSNIQISTEFGLVIVHKAK